MVVRPGSLRVWEVPVPGAQASFACCDRCAHLGTDRPSAIAGSGSATMVARRRLLKAAVSRRAAEGQLQPESADADARPSVTASTGAIGAACALAAPAKRR